MLVAAIVAATCVASALMVRHLREPVQRSFKALAAAVPDERDMAEQGYRQGPADPDTTALARKSLDLLPESARVMRAQLAVSFLAGPLAALAFGALPFVGLGSWSGLVGAMWGLAVGGATLKDKRTAVDLLALMMAPLAIPLSFSGPYPIGPLLAALAIYTGTRKVFDFKDAAGIRESNRERIADPKFLAMSTERRAGAIVRSRGGGGAGADASSARDNLSAT